MVAGVERDTYGQAFSYNSLLTFRALTSPILFDEIPRCQREEILINRIDTRRKEAREGELRERKEEPDFSGRLFASWLGSFPSRTRAM